MKYLYILVIILAIGAACHGQTTQNIKVSPYKFPLKAAPGNRYLVDQQNQPFFWAGEAAWSLIVQLNGNDADLYLNNRQEKGFTVIMVNLIEHKFSSNPPANFYGELPFTGKAFITPNEKYFAHADSVIETALRHNIMVMLYPIYLGYNCKDEGWCAEVKNASQNDLYEWGKYVGNRYKKFSNIVWLIGGDVDPSPFKEKVLAMIKGMKEVDTTHLLSAHNQPETMAITPWPGEKWLTVNNVYSYDSVIYKFYKTAYGHNPVLPYFQIESAYENEHNSTPQELRSYAYWALLSGAMGHVFGNCPIWHFGAAKTWCNTIDWKKEMNNQGSVSMDYLQRLFRSRSWEKLIPEFENELIISASDTWGTKDWIASAITSDGNTIIAYLPSKRKVTVNLSRIQGKKVKCWWYNPSNGKATEIGIFENSGIRSFTPESGGDQVLVIDNASAKFSAPGKEVIVR